jgi:NAD(P)-dependent dehydrogenase (short-subunit alcohol dehydrogenase family)
MNNTIAIITGGNRGLGKSTALKLAESGSDIIFSYRNNADEAAAVVAQIEALGRRAVALQLDVADIKSLAPFAASVRAVLAERWQRASFDYLVNNAGSIVRVTLAEATEEQFDSMMNVHLKSVFFLTQALLPLIADGGRIVNISTGLTRFTAPGSIIYGTMKGGLEVLTRYMAQELGPRGITVNTVAPGAIETDFGGAILRDNAQLNAHIKSLTALGRTGKPDDIGAAVASLLSPANGWVNGQRIEISGGVHL